MAETREERTRWRAKASVAMDRYAAGERAAFADLYTTIAPRLRAFFARRTRNNAALSDDLVQQTFLHIHHTRARFTRGADVMPWAFAIARRLLIDAMRTCGREILADDDELTAFDRDAPSAHAPDAELASRELATRLADELARLPSLHRAAFEMMRWEGRTANEAARALGVTALAVRLRAHRACEALRAVAAAA
jgi:RNA polymerase sigma-70 factor (ECF subfamily)